MCLLKVAIFTLLANLSSLAYLDKNTGLDGRPQLQASWQSQLGVVLHSPQPSLARQIYMETLHCVFMRKSMSPKKGA